MYGICNISATLNDVLRPCNGLGKSEPYVAPYKTELKLMSRRFNRWSRNQVLWGKFVDALKKLIAPEDLISKSFKTVVVYPVNDDVKDFGNIAQALDYAFDKGYRNKRNWLIINDKNKTVLTDSSIPNTLQGIIEGLYGVPFDGLGKPTIKLEFEDNAQLADFLKDNQPHYHYAQYTDVTASETSPNTATDAKANTRTNGKLMPAADSRIFPESPTASALPQTKTPPPLPPAPTAKALPEHIWTPLERQIKEIRKKYPDALLLFRVGDFFEAWGDDAITISIALNLPVTKRLGTSMIGIPSNALDKYLPNLVRQGYKVAICEQLEDANATNKIITKNGVLPVQEPPATNEPQPEPTEPEVTAESVTDEEIENSNVTPVEIDWKAFEDAFAKASNWSSFDPERSARSYIGGYKEYYDQYVKQVPPQYLNAFNWFVKRYVSDLISKRSRTASAAVTGPGGITAQKAASLNRANDRFMSASVEFPHALLKYINKIRLREKRNAFINSSIDERYAARIKELERDVNGLKYYKKLIQHISQGGEIPDDVRREYWYFAKDSYGGEPKFRDNVVNALQYRLNLNKATFKDKLTREVSNGNVEIVDAIIESLKPLGLFTNRAEIWQFPSFARRRRQSVDAEQQRVENNAQSENSLYRVEYDTQEDRVKIYFNGMPSDKIRTYLKSNGFRWSPRNKAWQRQITENARRAVRQFESLIQDGTLGKPTIKLEFEDNADLMHLFDTDGISGLTVNDKPAAVFNCPESQLQTFGYKPTYKRLANYGHLIDTSDGAKTLKGYGFDRSTLDELLNVCRQYRQVERLAEHLKDPDGDPLQSAFNVWHWLHTNISYNYDTPGEEEIRTPARTWADRKNGVDCDCLAVMTACLLLNMGYEPAFEIVAFNGSDVYSHIYVNLYGIAIDRVLPAFGVRPANITKTKIMEIPVYELSGVSGCDTSLRGVYASTLNKIQTGTATADDNNDYRKLQVLVTLKGIDDAAAKLATLLMPYVATVSDDGKYYFDSSNVATLAKKFDAELQALKLQGADDTMIQNWLQQVATQLNNVTATQDGEDTIVVIINPKGDLTNVSGKMVETDLQTLTPLTKTAVQQSNSAASETLPAIMQTSSAPATLTPDPDTESEEQTAPWWWLLGGMLAGFGIAAMSKNKKKTR